MIAQQNWISQTKLKEIVLNHKEIATTYKSNLNPLKRQTFSGFSIYMSLLHDDKEGRHYQYLLDIMTNAK